MNAPSSNSRNVGIKGLTAALASCIIGLSVMIFAFGLESNSEKPGTTNQKSSVKDSDQKTRTVSNFALGNAVVVAPELGLSVKTPDQSKVEPLRIVAKIEAQLLSIRKLYGMESEKSPALMGAMLFQLTLGASGEVVHVSEVDSHLADEDFRKAIVAEIGKWEFNDIAPKGTMINCPLLFVREGMDIRTVVKWEKTLGLFGRKTGLNDSRSDPGQDNKSIANGTPTNKTMRSQTPTSKQPAKKHSAEIFGNRQDAVPVDI